MRAVQPPRSGGGSRPRRSACRRTDRRRRAQPGRSRTHRPGPCSPRSSGSASARSSTTRSAACAAPRCSRRLRTVRLGAISMPHRAGPSGRPVVPERGLRIHRVRSPVVAKPDLMERVVNLCKAARTGLSVERDLRRVPLDLGLRPARRAPQAQRQGRLVALDGAAPRRRRRPRRRHPDGPQGVGGERPHRDVHRPARRLPQLQGALPGRPPAGVGRVPELRGQGLVHRGPQLQPDVQDLRRARSRTTPRSRTCGPRRRRASSSTSRTCRRRRARSRRSASRRSASRSATRSRPATSSSARASSSRWRWSSSSRPRTPTVVRVLVPGAPAVGTSTSASPRTSCGCARTTPRSCRTTRPGRPTSSSTSRGAGASSRASPTAPTST